jgi:hypothetical protein
VILPAKLPPPNDIKKVSNRPGSCATHATLPPISPENTPSHDPEIFNKSNRICGGITKQQRPDKIKNRPFVIGMKIRMQ